MRQHLAIYTSVASKNASMQRVKTPVKTPLLPLITSCNNPESYNKTYLHSNVDTSLSLPIASQYRISSFLALFDLLQRDFADIEVDVRFHNHSHIFAFLDRFIVHEPKYVGFWNSY